jgi:hypothetical protein
MRGVGVPWHISDIRPLKVKSSVGFMYAELFIKAKMFALSSQL